MNRFFDKLVSTRYAVRCRCVHNRAAVYHVRHQPLYRAIREPHSRNRKPVPASRVIERLMLLDAVISHPEIEWLATAADKIGFFTAAGSLDPNRWPHLTVGGSRRYFPDHLPIGVSRGGKSSLCSWLRVLSRMISRHSFNVTRSYLEPCQCGRCGSYCRRMLRQ